MRIAVLLVAVGPWSYTFCSAPPVYEERAEWSQSRSFQTERAWADLETMAAIGPRPLGSEGVEQARRYLRGELEALGLEVGEIDFAQVYEEEQAALVAAAREASEDGESAEEVFTGGADEGADPAAGPSAEDLGPLPRVLWAEIPGELSDVVLLGAAYATARDEEGPAANDVASGPAVVLELARQLAAQPLDYTTWVAFLEASPGEEAVGTGRVWAEILEREGVLSRIRMAMIFRRVGGIDLQIERDLRSHRSSREAFWRAATRGGRGGIFRSDVPTAPSEAAHQALRDAGIKRVVAFVGERSEDDAPADTLDQVSPESLGVVGQVALDGLGDITTRLARVDRLLPPPEPEPEPEPEPVAVLEEGPESEVVEDGESAASAGEEAATESAAPPDADATPSDAEAPPSDAEAPPPASPEGAASEPASP